MEQLSDKDLNIVTDRDLGYDEETEELAYSTEFDPYDLYMDSLMDGDR